MADLFRDTPFGQIVRLVTQKRYFRYADERDPSVWKRYLSVEKSRAMALYGTLSRSRTTEEKAVSEEPVENGASERISPSRTSREVQNGEIDEIKVDPERGRDVRVIDWYGPHDKDNPMNWSLVKKVFVTFQICLLTFSIYIGSAIYSAGIQSVVKDFGVSQVAATLGLTLFVAGYGTGPMIWAPMSEIPQIGRNPVYVTTLAFFVILQVPTALATNFGMLMAFRFITGFVGSPVLATGGASIGDMFRPQKRAYGVGLWGIAAVCGPTMGPLIGGFAAEAKGWRWTIWELLWLSGFCLVFLFFFFPETSSSNILYRRSQRLKGMTGMQNLKCEPEILAEDMTPKDIALRTLVRPITLNFYEPMVFLLNLYIALVYGLLYIWFESFPIVFIQLYHFTLGLEGLAFLGILIGTIVVIPPFFWYLYRYTEPLFNDAGELKPEIRLKPAFVGCFFIPICLFWFGWSARPNIHWIMPIIGSSYFSIGTFILFNSVLNYLGDAYPEYAASVLAGNDLMRSSFGAGCVSSSPILSLPHKFPNKAPPSMLIRQSSYRFPLFANAMYKNLGTAWASSTLAFLSIAFIPIPFGLYYFGERLRRKSRFARKDF